MPRTFRTTQTVVITEFSELEILDALRAFFDIPPTLKLSIRGMVKGPGACCDATPERVIHVAHYEDVTAAESGIPDQPDKEHTHE
ncbi:hypothetical protein ACVDG3_18265 [Meridianimarinicoccus sp. RP-17]|uniref:hypothetical protein n=1 Tax=Meridianimarinicoccus zhengii TaxID=2056810 RepID=UPI000DACAD0E|nr:hypothetical protein [Phycocomes zhengii]